MSKIVTKFGIGDQVGARDRNAACRSYAVGCVSEIRIVVTKKGTLTQYEITFVNPKDNDSWNRWFSEDELEEVR